jgi:hypothetical protein
VRGPRLSIQQQRGEIRQVAFVGQRQYGPQTLEVDVFGAHVVAARRRPAARFGQHGVRGLAGERQHGFARRLRPRVHQVHDGAARRSHNRGVGLAGEIAYRRRVPVVAPRHAARRVHPLLHHGPTAVAAHHEGVEVDLESIGDRVVVDARREAAGADERAAVKPFPLRHRQQFVRRAPGMPPAAAADVNAEFAGARVEPAFERSHYRSGDAGGVPVHPHHATERLKPERVAQAREQRLGAVAVDDGLGDGGAEQGHAFRQPRRHAAAV